jgi:hypothetical protein
VRSTAGTEAGRYRIAEVVNAEAVNVEAVTPEVVDAQVVNADVVNPEVDTSKKHSPWLCWWAPSARRP